MHLLMTGSSGQIGSAMLKDLCRQYEITGYDIREPATLPQRVRFIQGDVRDRETLNQAMVGVDVVLHLAAIAFDVPPLHEVFSVNVQGTYNALDLAVENGVECFLYTSSIMAYGFGQNADPQYFPIDEEHPMLANRTYGLSKIVSERLCRSFTERCGIRTICFQLTAAMASEKSYADLPWHDRTGELGAYQYFDVRDFTSLVEAAIQATHIDHDVFLVGAADSARAEPTAEVIRKYYPEAELRYDRLDDRSPFVSTEKARRALGFEPRYSWRQ
ncbi:MAG: NAD(P)-dependent oxidoreductase [Gemmatimonadetes bacterium]|jgi:nucleoside-diphosphate-sugar epimerase|nr:NAD(P)-dependent oxidoreductase [Gemmatimonadota bacterium]